MALKTNKLAAATAVAAALSMLAAPAAAIDLPTPSGAKVYDGDALNAERDRRHRRHRDRDGIDAGDVVAGVVVLGAIAAIAGAAKNRRDRERYEESYPAPDQDYGYQTPGQYGRNDSRGIDRAVDMCVGEVERGSGRVGSVDSATRAGDGWHISGELESGASYSCTIGNDGRFSDVRVADDSEGYTSSGNVQYDDDYYATARAGQDSAEPGYDSRYETSQSSDFEQ